MAKRIEYPADFMAFYAAYPKERHQGYVLPYKSWKRLVDADEMPPIETIIAAIESQKQTRAWQQGYIQMMSTWLNQKMWEAAIEDNSVAKEVVQAERNLRKEEFIQDQQAINSEWLVERNKQVEFLVYNTAKLLPDLHIDGVLTGIARFLVFNDSPLFIPSDTQLFSTECAIADAIHDFLALRYKGVGYDSIWAQDSVKDYYWTILFILVTRHCNSNGIDILTQCAKLPVRECTYMRRILFALTIPKTCLEYREKYNVAPYYSPDKWLLAFSADTILNNFPEVV